MYTHDGLTQEQKIIITGTYNIPNLIAQIIGELIVHKSSDIQVTTED